MEKNYHFFASCVFGWATAETRHEAIKKLVNHFRGNLTDIVKSAHKNGEPGAYVWTCYVHAPGDAKYNIEYFAPKDVKTSHGRDHYVTYLTKKEISYWTNNEEEQPADPQENPKAFESEAIEL